MKRLFLLFVLVATAVACRDTAVRSIDDFTVEAYSPRYATGFDIRSAEGSESLLLVVRDPWQGAEGVEKRLFISRDGEAAPAGFDGRTLDGEAARIVCMSSSYVAMLDAIGCTDRVVGVSGADFIYNDAVRKGCAEGRIGDVGYDAEMNFERLVSLRPDIVLIYGISGENSTTTGKLDELGIPYFYIGDYLEESPLGKAEWLVAVGEIAGCGAEARERFDSISVRYERMRNRVASAKSIGQPSVMFNSPYGDTWYMPSSRSYVVRLVEDAGGEYVYDGNDGNSSLPIDAEQAYVLADRADCWINVGAYATLGELRSAIPRFAGAPAVRNGRVYAADKRSTLAGGSDYWESAVVNPDLVLRDMITILHPEIDSSELYYYRKLE